MRLTPLALAAAAALAACDDPAPAGDFACSRELRKLIPFDQPRAVDLLFIVDRTASMADEHPTLLANAPQFANVLQQLEGGLPDLHVAVVTTDLGGEGVAGCGAGDGARFQGGERCGLAGSFLRARQGDTGLADAFTCLLDLPLSTCPVNQPIGALIGALDGGDATNDGFRREGVPLLIVFITDGDDCSLVEPVALTGLATEADVDGRCASLGEPPLASIADSIDWIRPADPKLLLGSLIGGAPPRLAQLRAALPDRYYQIDIAGENWTDAFVHLAWSGPATIGNPCFPPTIDMQPSIPGIQPECVGSFHTLDGSIRLPWCSEPGAGRPCMRVVEDEQWCPGDLKLHVETTDARITGPAWVDVSCAIPCA
ncbi:MAG: hypothetical protein K8M05_34545 [Deltaproteobacteria bacterium]|nr:hypothetical protein [Kofleriaceae bacterium]